MSEPVSPVVEAAGGVLWRQSGQEREVALVHRPRYDDWSLPKGKRKSGEGLLAAAVREVTEETGFLTQVGPYLGQYRYPVTVGGRPAVKKVKYWAMQEMGGSFQPTDEVDEVVWLGVGLASARVQRRIDHKVLQSFVRLPDRTSVLIVIRNGPAVRVSGRADAQHRDLNRRGEEQARALVPTLTSLGIDTLLSTPARRCLQTLQPYAAEQGIEVRVDEALTRALGRGADPVPAAQRLLELAGAGNRVAVCAEAAIPARLVAQLATGPANGPRRVAIGKGEWCLLHVGAGRLLSMERRDEP